MSGDGSPTKSVDHCLSSIWKRQTGIQSARCHRMLCSSQTDYENHHQGNHYSDHPCNLSAVGGNSMAGSTRYKRIMFFLSSKTKHSKLKQSPAAGPRTRLLTSGVAIAG